MGYFSRCKKWVSFIVAVFMLAEAMFPSQAWSVTAADLFTREVRLPQFVLPSELGLVKEAIPGRNGKTLIHILDAHGHLEAQASIGKILRHLKSTTRFDRLLVEGAIPKKLNPELYHFFHSAVQSRKAVRALMELGELSGAEAWLVDETIRGCSKDCTVATGVEDADLYAKNIELFRAQVSQSLPSAILKLQSVWSNQLALLSPELKKHLLERRALTENRLEWKDWMLAISIEAREILGLDLKNPLLQNEWPMLVRYALIEAHEKELNVDQVRADWNRLQLELNRLSLTEYKKIFEQVLRPQTPQAALREQMEKFAAQALPLGLKFENYPVFMRAAGLKILSQELDAENLRSESLKLSVLILRKLASTPVAVKAVGEGLALEWLGKLLRLQMDSEEWQRREKFLPVLKRLASVNLTQENDRNEFSVVISRSIDFYRTASRRDEAIFKNLESAAANQNSATQVLVTGGFHENGIRERLIQEGYGYIAIQPMIHSISSADQKRYRNAMLETTNSTVQELTRLLSQESLPPVLRDLVHPEFRAAQVLSALAGRLPDRRGTMLSLGVAARSELRAVPQGVVDEGTAEIFREVFNKIINWDAEIASALQETSARESVKVYWVNEAPNGAVYLSSDDDDVWVGVDKKLESLLQGNKNEAVEDVLSALLAFLAIAALAGKNSDPSIRDGLLFRLSRSDLYQKAKAATLPEDFGKVVAAFSKVESEIEKVKSTALPEGTRIKPRNFSDWTDGNWEVTSGSNGDQKYKLRSVAVAKLSIYTTQSNGAESHVEIQYSDSGRFIASLELVSHIYSGHFKHDNPRYIDLVAIKQKSSLRRMPLIDLLPPTSDRPKWIWVSTDEAYPVLKDLWKWPGQESTLDGIPIELVPESQIIDRFRSYGDLSFDQAKSAENKFFDVVASHDLDAIGKQVITFSESDHWSDLQCLMFEVPQYIALKSGDFVVAVKKEIVSSTGAGYSPRVSSQKVGAYGWLVNKSGSLYLSDSSQSDVNLAPLDALGREKNIYFYRIPAEWFKSLHDKRVQAAKTEKGVPVMSLTGSPALMPAWIAELAKLGEAFLLEIKPGADGQIAVEIFKRSELRNQIAFASVIGFTEALVAPARSEARQRPAETHPALVHVQNYYGAKSKLKLALKQGNPILYRMSLSQMRDSAAASLKTNPTNDEWIELTQFLKGKADLPFDKEEIQDSLEITRVEGDDAFGWTAKKTEINPSIKSFLKDLGYDAEEQDDLFRNIDKILAPLTLTNMLPDAIDDQEGGFQLRFDPQGLAALLQNIFMFERMEQVGFGGGLFMGSTESGLSILVSNQPWKLQESILLHEIIHYLAFRNVLSFDVSNEIITTAVTSAVLLKNNAMADIIDGLFAAIDKETKDLHWRLVRDGQKDGKAHARLRKPEQLKGYVRHLMESLPKFKEMPEVAINDMSERLAGFYLGAYYHEFSKSEKGNPSPLKLVVNYGKLHLPKVRNPNFMRRLMPRDWQYIDPIVDKKLRPLAQMNLKNAKAFGGDFQMKPWSWRDAHNLNQPRWSWDEKRQVFRYMPWDVLEYGESASRGLTAQEIFRANFGEAGLMEPDFEKNAAFKLLFGVADTLRLTASGLSSYQGLIKDVESFYRKKNRIYDLDIEKQITAAKPKFVQYIEALFYSITLSDSNQTVQDPRVTDPLVLDVLKKTLDPIFFAFSNNGRDFYAKIRDQIWPEVKRLLWEDEKKAEQDKLRDDALNKLIEEGKFKVKFDPNQSPGQQGQPPQKPELQDGQEPEFTLSPPSPGAAPDPMDLSDKAREMLDKKMKEVYDSLTPEQKALLKQQAQQELQKQIDQASREMQDVTSDPRAGKKPQEQQPGQEDQQSQDGGNQGQQAGEQGSQTGQAGSQSQNGQSGKQQGSAAGEESQQSQDGEQQGGGQGKGQKSASGQGQEQQDQGNQSGGGSKQQSAGEGQGKQAGEEQGGGQSSMGSSSSSSPSKSDSKSGAQQSSGAAGANRESAQEALDEASNSAPGFSKPTYPQLSDGEDKPAKGKGAGSGDGEKENDASPDKSQKGKGHNAAEQLQQQMDKLREKAATLKKESQDVEQAAKAAAQQAKTTEDQASSIDKTGASSEEQARELKAAVEKLTEEIRQMREHAADFERTAQATAKQVEKALEESKDEATTQALQKLADEADKIAQESHDIQKKAIQADRDHETANPKAEEIAKETTRGEKADSDKVRGRAQAIRDLMQRIVDGIKAMQKKAAEAERKAGEMGAQADSIAESAQQAADSQPGSAGQGAGLGAEGGSGGAGNGTPDGYWREQDEQPEDSAPEPTKSEQPAKTMGDQGLDDAVRELMEAAAQINPVDEKAMRRAVDKQTGLSEDQRVAINKIRSISDAFRATMREQLLREIQENASENMHADPKKGKLRVVSSVVNERLQFSRRNEPDEKKIRIALMIDVSGSMFEDPNNMNLANVSDAALKAMNRINNAVKTAVLFMEAFRGLENVELEIGLFSEKDKIVLPFGEEITDKKIYAVVQNILNHNLGSGTWNSRLLARMVSDLKKREESEGEAHKILVAVSDGIADDSDVAAIQSILEKNKDDVVFIPVGIGPQSAGIVKAYAPHGRKVKSLAELAQNLGTWVRDSISKYFKTIATLMIGGFVAWAFQTATAHAAFPAVMALMPLVGFQRSEMRTAPATRATMVRGQVNSVNFDYVDDGSDTYLVRKGTADMSFRAKINGVGNNIPELSIDETPTNVEKITEIIMSAEEQEYTGSYTHLEGDAGAGKNTQLFYAAKLLRKNVQFVAMHEDITPEDLIERRGIGEKEKGKTDWIMGAVAHAMEHGEWVVLDEIDKAKPYILKTLNQIISSRKIKLHDGRVVVAKPGFALFSTGNPVATGNDEKTYAVKSPSAEGSDRRSVVKFDYLPPTEEQEVLLKQLMKVRGISDPRRVSAAENKFITDLIEVANNIRTQYRNIDPITKASNGRGKIIARPMTTRVMKKMVSRLALFPGEIDRARTLVKRFYSYDFEEAAQQANADGIITAKFRDAPYVLTKADREGPKYTQDKSGARFIEFAGVQVPLGEHAPSDLNDIPLHMQVDWIDTNLQLLREVMMDFKQGNPLLFIGEMGTGKSLIAEYLSYAIYGDIETFGLTKDTAVEDLIGYVGIGEGEYMDHAGMILNAKEGQTGVVPSYVVRAMRAGVPAILDEINAGKPEVLAVLNNITEFGWIDLPNGIRVYAKPGFMLMGTMNPPNSRVYLGIKKFSAEFFDRFSVYKMDYLPKDEEVKILKNFNQYLTGKNSAFKTLKDELIEKMVDMVNELREAYGNNELPRPVSMRGLKRLIVRLARYPDQYKTKLEELVINRGFNFPDPIHQQIVIDKMNAVKLGDFNEIVEINITTGLKDLDAALISLRGVGADAAKANKALAALESALSNNKSKITEDQLKVVREAFQHFGGDIPDDPVLLKILKIDLASSIASLAALKSSPELPEFSDEVDVEQIAEALTEKKSKAQKESWFLNPYKMPEVQKYVRKHAAVLKIKAKGADAKAISTLAVGGSEFLLIPEGLEDEVVLDQLLDAALKESAKRVFPGDAAAGKKYLDLIRDFTIMKKQAVESRYALMKNTASKGAWLADHAAEVIPKVLEKLPKDSPWQAAAADERTSGFLLVLMDTFDRIHFDHHAALITTNSINLLDKIQSLPELERTIVSAALAAVYDFAIDEKSPEFSAARDPTARLRDKIYDNGIKQWLPPTFSARSEVRIAADRVPELVTDLNKIFDSYALSDYAHHLTFIFQTPDEYTAPFDDGMSEALKQRMVERGFMLGEQSETDELRGSKKVYKHQLVFNKDAKDFDLLAILGWVDDTIDAIEYYKPHQPLPVVTKGRDWLEALQKQEERPHLIHSVPGWGALIAKYSARSEMRVVNEPNIVSVLNPANGGILSEPAFKPVLDFLKGDAEQIFWSKELDEVPAIIRHDEGITYIELNESLLPALESLSGEDLRDVMKVLVAGAWIQLGKDAPVFTADWKKATSLLEKLGVQDWKPLAFVREVKDVYVKAWDGVTSVPLGRHTQFELRRYTDGSPAIVHGNYKGRGLISLSLGGLKSKLLQVVFDPPKNQFIVITADGEQGNTALPDQWGEDSTPRISYVSESEAIRNQVRLRALGVVFESLSARSEMRVVNEPNITSVLNPANGGILSEPTFRPVLDFLKGDADQIFWDDSNENPLEIKDDQGLKYIVLNETLISGLIALSTEELKSVLRVLIAGAWIQRGYDAPDVAVDWDIVNPIFEKLGIQEWAPLKKLREHAAVVNASVPKKILSVMYPWNWLSERDQLFLQFMAKNGMKAEILQVGWDYFTQTIIAVLRETTKQNGLPAEVQLNEKDGLKTYKVAYYTETQVLADPQKFEPLKINFEEEPQPGDLPKAWRVAAPHELIPDDLTGVSQGSWDILLPGNEDGLKLHIGSDGGVLDFDFKVGFGMRLQASINFGIWDLIDARYDSAKKEIWFVVEDAAIEKAKTEFPATLGGKDSVPAFKVHVLSNSQAVERMAQLKPFGFEFTVYRAGVLHVKSQMGQTEYASGLVVDLGVEHGRKRELRMTFNGTRIDFELAVLQNDGSKPTDVPPQYPFSAAVQTSMDGKLIDARFNPADKSVWVVVKDDFAAFAKKEFPRRLADDLMPEPHYSLNVFGESEALGRRKDFEALGFEFEKSARSEARSDVPTVNDTVRRDWLPAFTESNVLNSWLTTNLASAGDLETLQVFWSPDLKKNAAIWKPADTGSYVLGLSGDVKKAFAKLKDPEKIKPFAELLVLQEVARMTSSKKEEDTLDAQLNNEFEAFESGVLKAVLAIPAERRSEFAKSVAKSNSLKKTAEFWDAIQSEADFKQRRRHFADMFAAAGDYGEQQIAATVVNKPTAAAVGDLSLRLLTHLETTKFADVAVALGRQALEQKLKAAIPSLVKFWGNNDIQKILLAYGSDAVPFLAEQYRRENHDNLLLFIARFVDEKNLRDVFPFFVDLIMDEKQTAGSRQKAFDALRGFKDLPGFYGLLRLVFSWSRFVPENDEDLLGALSFFTIAKRGSGDEYESTSTTADNNPAYDPEKQSEVVLPYLERRFSKTNYLDSNVWEALKRNKSMRALELVADFMKTEFDVRLDGTSVVVDAIRFPKEMGLPDFKADTATPGPVSTDSGSLSRFSDLKLADYKDGLAALHNSLKVALAIIDRLGGAKEYPYIQKWMSYQVKQFPGSDEVKEMVDLAVKLAGFEKAMPDLLVWYQAFPFASNQIYLILVEHQKEKMIDWVRAQWAVMESGPSKLDDAWSKRVTMMINYFGDFGTDEDLGKLEDFMGNKNADWRTPATAAYLKLYTRLARSESRALLTPHATQVYRRIVGDKRSEMRVVNASDFVGVPFEAILEKALMRLKANSESLESYTRDVIGQDPKRIYWAEGVNDRSVVIFDTEAKSDISSLAIGFSIEQKSIFEEVLKTSDLSEAFEDWIYMWVGHETARALQFGEQDTTQIDLTADIGAWIKWTNKAWLGLTDERRAAIKKLFESVPVATTWIDFLNEAKEKSPEDAAEILRGKMPQVYKKQKFNAGQLNTPTSTAQSLLELLKEANSGDVVGSLGNLLAQADYRAAISVLASKLTFAEAVAPLVTFGAHAVNAIIEKFNHGHETEKTNAAKALGDISDTRALDVLVQGLSGETPDLRKTSAEALLKVEDKNLVAQAMRRSFYLPSVLPEDDALFETVLEAFERNDSGWASTQNAAGLPFLAVLLHHQHYLETNGSELWKTIFNMNVPLAVHLAKIPLQIQFKYEGEREHGGTKHNILNSVSYPKLMRKTDWVTPSGDSDTFEKGKFGEYYSGSFHGKSDFDQLETAFLYSAKIIEKYQYKPSKRDLIRWLVADKHYPKEDVSLAMIHSLAVLLDNQSLKDWIEIYTVRFVHTQRALIVEVMAKILNDKALPLLRGETIREASVENEKELKIALARAIAQIGTAADLDVFKVLQNDGESTVREAVIAAISVLAAKPAKRSELRNLNVLEVQNEIVPGFISTFQAAVALGPCMGVFAIPVALRAWSRARLLLQPFVPAEQRNYSGLRPANLISSLVRPAVAAEPKDWVLNYRTPAELTDARIAVIADWLSSREDFTARIYIPGYEGTAHKNIRERLAKALRSRYKALGVAVKMPVEWLRSEAALDAFSRSGRETLVMSTDRAQAEHLWNSGLNRTSNLVVHDDAHADQDSQATALLAALEEFLAPQGNRNRSVTNASALIALHTELIAAVRQMFAQSA